MLRRACVALLCLLLVPALGGRAWAAVPSDPPRQGPYLASISYETWKDSRRAGREVPVKLYRPQGAPGPWPVVIISHGLGDSRDSLGYLARFLCSHGYYVAAMQHYGSDMSLGEDTNRLVAAWRLWRAAREPRNYLLRAGDLAFVLQQLSQREHQRGPCKNNIDLNNVAMMGHSMGALTTLLAVGQLFATDVGLRSLRDPVPKAFIVFSPPVSQDHREFARAYNSIGLPGLHVSGGQDEARLGLTPAEERRVPFDHIILADQYLLWLNDADHRTPLGYPPGPDRPEREARYHQLILMACRGFLDAYLREDPAALTWIRGPKMFRAVNGDGAWETKRGRGSLQLK
ncbi:MAG: alpha/beta hydrolase [Deltaproteobacteria bacterium]|nr:alpha/beta hydrolase [Deltaproteobacteria bacterium]